MGAELSGPRWPGRCWHRPGSGHSYVHVSRPIRHLMRVGMTGLDSGGFTG